MTVLNCEVFSPANAAEGGDVVLVGNIMGGTLAHPGGQPGDHAYRAEVLCEKLNQGRTESGEPPVHVIAYERRGTGSMRSIFDVGAHGAVQPNGRHADTAKWTAEALQAQAEPLQPKRKFMFGASSAGTDAIMVATSAPDILQLDGLAVFDPIGTRTTTTRQGFRDWLNYQLHTEPQKPEEMQNQHGQTLSKVGGLVAVTASLIRTVPEMSRYANVWRNPTAREGLQRLATEQQFGHMALLVVLPGHTFTNASEGYQGTEKMVWQLSSSAARSRRPTPTEFRREPDLYHSWTDDPTRVAPYIEELVELASEKAA